MTPGQAMRLLAGERTCRGCGCTDKCACPGGCSWVLLDIDEPSGICSVCAEALEWNPTILVNVGVGGMTADDIREQLRGAP